MHCRTCLSEFHTVGTDTEKARGAKLKVTAGFENRWTDDDLSRLAECDRPREGTVNMTVA